MLCSHIGTLIVLGRNQEIVLIDIQQAVNHNHGHANLAYLPCILPPVLAGGDDISIHALGLHPPDDLQFTLGIVECIADGKDISVAVSHPLHSQHQFRKHLVGKLRDQDSYYLALLALKAAGRAALDIIQLFGRRLNPAPHVLAYIALCRTIQDIGYCCRCRSRPLRHILERGILSFHKVPSFITIGYRQTFACDKIIIP